MSDRLKLDLQLAATADEAPVNAARLESLGIDGGFTFDSGHDVFLPLATAAPVTSLDLTTNVAMAFPRSPMVLATMANDLQLLSRGRFRLGLGTQVKPHVEKRFGSTWGNPVEHMREWVLAIRAIFAAWNERRPLDFRGEYTSHTLMTPAFDPGANPHGPPKVLVGALGPRMNEMAAETADGVLVMPFNSERHMDERTIPAIERGLTRSGRVREDYEVTVEVIVGMGRSPEELERARAIRQLIAFYASTPAYRPVLEVENREDLQPELRAMSKRGEWDRMGDLVDEEILETIGVLGTPEECAAEIVRRFGRHADRVCAYFPNHPISDDMIADFAQALRQKSS